MVLYENAFDNGASVRVRYAAASFSVDVVLTRQLPDLALLQLGGDSADLDLVVFTEWFGTQPTAEAREWPLRAGSGLTDSQLWFDELVMDAGGGPAFQIDGQGAKAGPEIGVRKEWVRDFEGDRTFLLEKTALSDLRPLLKDLPEASAPSPEQRRRMEKSRRTAKLELPPRRGPVPA